MGRRKEDGQLLIPGIGGFSETLRVDGEERNRRAKRSPKRKSIKGIERVTDAIQQGINFLHLPSIPLEEKWRFPKKVSCVYFVITKDDELLYIGRAIDLYTRWQSHHYLEKLATLNGVKLAWLQVPDIEELPKLEYELIKLLSPPLNRTNGLSKVRKKVKIKSKTFRMRLTEEEYDLIEKEADRRNVCMSQIVRELIVTLNKKPQ